MATDINYYLNQIVNATYGEEVRWAIHDAIALINQNAGSGGGSSIPDEALNNGYTHKNIYRGNYLGDSITDEQYHAIYNGTFDDMYIGDFWALEINGSYTLLQIADFDYFYSDKYYNLNNSHHVVLMNKYPAGSDAMNTDDQLSSNLFSVYTTSKAYTDSSSSLNTYRAKLKSYFGDLLLPYYDSLPNSPSEHGLEKTFACHSDCVCEMLSEYMISGTESRSRYWDSIQASTDQPSDNARGPMPPAQLALFRLNPNAYTQIMTRNVAMTGGASPSYYRIYSSHSGWATTLGGSIYATCCIQGYPEE